MTEKSSTAQIRAPKVYGLRPKQKKVAKLIGLKDATPTEAVKEVYDTKYPSQMANALKKNPKFVQAVQSFRDHLDSTISDDTMVKKAKELLHAEVEGTPHYQIQQKQWDSIAKIKGYYPNDSQKHLHLHGEKDVLESMYEDLDNGVIDQNGTSDQK